MTDQYTLTTSATILEGEAGQIARINRMVTLLGDLKHGIQGRGDRQHMAEDAFRLLREARELAQEMSK